MPKLTSIIAFVLCFTASFASAHETIPDTPAIIQAVLPSVVAITTKTLVEGAPREIHIGMAKSKESFGSGFIIDPTGYIATNRHVVDGAFDVIVTLADGSRVNGAVVGSGRKYDLAIIKINPKNPLPAVKFGDSDALKIGESLLVVGNPYGLGISASSGIVSGLRRNLSMTQFDRFIQTDAAINHGNSGGPIFNMKGEVVGISTALYTGGAVKGGSIGIGFAIPSAIASKLLVPLREYGYLRLGSFEVNAQAVTPEIAMGLGVPQSGVILAEVSPSGPASGLLKPGDIMTELDGAPIGNVDNFYGMVAAGIGKTFAVKVWRDGAVSIINVKAVQWAEEQPDGRISEIPSQKGSRQMRFGVDVAPISPELRTQFHLSANEVGLVVTAVLPDTPGAAAGFSVGDVIQRVQVSNFVQSADINSASSPEAAMSAMEKGSKRLSEWKAREWPYVVVLVRGSQGPRFMTMPLEDWAE